MANQTIGVFGSSATSGIEMHDHNGMIEFIPIGHFDYAILSSEEAARLAEAIISFLRAPERHPR